MGSDLKKLKKIIPFDQFSRQIQVSYILNRQRSVGQSFKILDVGGYKGHTSDFLFNDSVTVLDLYDIVEPNYIKGSALKMPFKQQSFDYVLSFDVLEHIENNKRKLFFDECARVSKYGVILCAPHKTRNNELAEESLIKLYNKIHQEPHQWIKEHILYGLPDFKALKDHAVKRGFYVTTFCSNKTLLWFLMQQAIFINSGYSIAAQNLEELNFFYNDTFKFDGGNTQSDSYRLILCCFKKELDLAKVEKNDQKSALNEEQEIKLFEKLSDFYVSLAQKETTLSGNYQELYEFALLRSEQLQKNNEELWQRINSLEKKVNNSFMARIEKKIKAKKRDD